MAPEALKASELLKGFINQPFKATNMALYHKGKDLYKRLVYAIMRLSLVDLNFVLYYCDKEQRVYNVPGHGPLTYCGLQGEWSIIIGCLYSLYWNTRLKFFTYSTALMQHRTCLKFFVESRVRVKQTYFST